MAETKETRDKNVIYLELEVVKINGKDRPITFDGRQLVGMADKDLFDLRKDMEKLVEENKGDSTFDEMELIDRALKSPQLERDSEGKVETFQQMGGVTTPKRRGFDLDEQRQFNRIVNCIESLQNKNSKKIVVEFHKNAELLQPKWEDLEILHTVVTRHIEENVTELGMHYVDLHDKILDAKLEADALITKKA